MNSAPDTTDTVVVTDTAPTVAPATVNDVQRGISTPFQLSGSDSDGDPLTYAVVDQSTLPAGTTLSCDPTGACTILVPPNTAVADYSFTYKANDNTLDSNTSTVTVGVENTAPTAGDVGPIHHHGGRPVAVTLAGSRPQQRHPHLHRPRRRSQPGSGVSGTGPDVTYTPNPDTKGADSFTYTASDNAPSTSNQGTVSIVIDNSPPTADAQTISAPRGVATPVTLTGEDVNGDSLTFAPQTFPTKGSLVCPDQSGACSYTAGPGQTGDDSFTYVANDGTANSSPATVTIHITNQAPTGDTIAVNAQRLVPTLITLTGSDPNSDPLTFNAPITGSSKGTLSCDATGACSYTSGAGQSGTDSFTYSVSDGFGGTGTGTVNITLLDAAPKANPQTVLSAGAGAPTLIALSGSDPENDPLTYTAPLSGPTKGTLSCTGPDCVYTAFTGQIGTDSFTFSVDDGLGGSDSATVTITLNGSVTGIATDVTTGLPVSAVNVRLFSANGLTPIAVTTTDANGNYAFGEVPPGQYYVQFAKAGSYLTSWYANGDLPTDSTPITIAAGGGCGGQPGTAAHPHCHREGHRQRHRSPSGRRSHPGVQRPGRVLGPQHLHQRQRPVHAELAPGRHLRPARGGPGVRRPVVPGLPRPAALQPGRRLADVVARGRLLDAAPTRPARPSCRAPSPMPPPACPCRASNVRIWYTFLNTFITTTTDANGHYAINSVPPGSYEVQYARSSVQLGLVPERHRPRHRHLDHPHDHQCHDHRHHDDPQLRRPARRRFVALVDDAPDPGPADKPARRAPDMKNGGGRRQSPAEPSHWVGRRPARRGRGSGPIVEIAARPSQTARPGGPISGLATTTVPAALSCSARRVGSQNPVEYSPR